MIRDITKWTLKKINFVQGNKFYHWIQVEVVDGDSIGYHDSNYVLVFRVFSSRGGVQVKVNKFKAEQSAHAYLLKVMADKNDMRMIDPPVEAYQDSASLWQAIVAFSPEVGNQKSHYTADLLEFGIKTHSVPNAFAANLAVSAAPETPANYGTW